VKLVAALPFNRLSVLNCSGENNALAISKGGVQIGAIEVAAHIAVMREYIVWGRAQHSELVGFVFNFIVDRCNDLQLDAAHYQCKIVLADLSVVQPSVGRL